MANDERVKCPVCAELFKDRAGLSGHMRFKHPDIPEPKKEDIETVIIKAPVLLGKPHPVEAIIDELRLPKEADGHGDIFDAGVGYGMRTVLIGIRLAQEVSNIGVQQAKPLIDMAREMRQAEGQAAQQLAGEVAGAIQGSHNELMDGIKQLQMGQQGNPMMTMMMPFLQNAVSQLMQAFGGMGAQPQPSQQQPQDQGQAPAQQQLNPPNIEEHSLDERGDYGV